MPSYDVVRGVRGDRGLINISANAVINNSRTSANPSTALTTSHSLPLWLLTYVVFDVAISLHAAGR